MTSIMPIRPDQRWFYPIDWPQLSAAIRFGRARACCERCGRPHRRRVTHLGDGRWWDSERQGWRSDRGRHVSVAEPFALEAIRTTYVVLACAHLDHNLGNNRPGNLAALCQRCHMLHDAEEHRWRRWWNVFRQRAVRDLYEDPHARLDYWAAARRAGRRLATGSPRSVHNRVGGQGL